MLIKPLYDLDTGLIFVCNQGDTNFICYLTIIRRRRGDSPIITEPEANNCFSIFTQAFVSFETEFILISLIFLSVNFRTVRYTDIPKISVSNRKYRYQINIGNRYRIFNHTDIPKFPIYRNFSVYRVKFTNYMAKP